MVLRRLVIFRLMTHKMLVSSKPNMFRFCPSSGNMTVSSGYFSINTHLCVKVFLILQIPRTWAQEQNIEGDLSRFRFQHKQRNLSR